MPWLPTKSTTMDQNNLEELTTKITTPRKSTAGQAGTKEKN
jgi:hypothetical protein